MVTATDFERPNDCECGQWRGGSLQHGLSDGGGRMGLRTGELHPILVMSLATKTGPYIYTWSFKSTLISARANFCSRNPNLLVLPISARGTARFENNHFSNVCSFAGNCARLREIALVVRPVFFESETGSENSRSARLANFCS